MDLVGINGIKLKNVIKRIVTEFLDYFNKIVSEQIPKPDVSDIFGVFARWFEFTETSISGNHSECASYGLIEFYFSKLQNSADFKDDLKFVQNCGLKTQFNPFRPTKFEFILVVLIEHLTEFQNIENDLPFVFKEDKFDFIYQKIINSIIENYFEVTNYYIISNYGIEGVDTDFEINGVNYELIFSSLEKRIELSKILTPLLSNQDWYKAYVFEYMQFLKECVGWIKCHVKVNLNQINDMTGEFPHRYIDNLSLIAPEFIEEFFRLLGFNINIEYFSILDRNCYNLLSLAIYDRKVYCKHGYTTQRPKWAGKSPVFLTKWSRNLDFNTTTRVFLLAYLQKRMNIKSSEISNLVLNRFSTLFSNRNDYDIVIDCVIILESVLSTSITELKYQFQLKLAYILGESAFQKVLIKDFAKRTYNIRSDIVHSGKPGKNSIQRFGGMSNYLTMLKEFTRLILLFLITEESNAVVFQLESFKDKLDDLILNRNEVLKNLLIQQEEKKFFQFVDTFMKETSWYKNLNKNPL